MESYNDIGAISPFLIGATGPMENGNYLEARGAIKCNRIDHILKTNETASNMNGNLLRSIKWDKKNTLVCNLHLCN